MKVKLEDVCEKGSSSLKQADVENKSGEYPIYGASGYVGNVGFYQQAKQYVAVVKDGAGIGRTTLHPAKSSIIGTTQYLIPKTNVLPEYFYYVVRYMHLGKYFSGATIPHIYFRDYKNEEFNLDVLDEQKEIVRILGKIASIIEARQQEIQRLDVLVKSWFAEMFGDTPKKMLGKWPARKLADCVEGIDSGKSPNCKSEPRLGLNPRVLKLSALSSGVFLSEENKALLDGEEVAQGKAICEGDILVARKNTPELVGACVLVKEDVTNLMFPDLVFRMHPTKVVEGAYLSSLLFVLPFANEVRALVHGSAKSMSNMPKSELRELMLPLLSLPLQREFAAFVAQVDKSKVVVKQAFDEAQLLFDSLMQKYFG